jgi:hypothetical protein
VAGHAIAIARGDGSGRRVLASGGASTISPDGAVVAVIDYEAGATGASRIGLYSAAGGAPTKVLKIQCARIYWSPDSTRFACVDTDFSSKPSRLLVVNAAGGAVSTLGKGHYDIPELPPIHELAYVQRTSIRTQRDAQAHRPDYAGDLDGPRRRSTSGVGPECDRL